MTKHFSFFRIAILIGMLSGAALADDAKSSGSIVPGLSGIIVLQPEEKATDTPEFHLNAGDVTKATVKTDSNDGRLKLLLVFTEEKRAEFGRFTSANAGKKVRVIVNGQIVSEPTIRQMINGPSMEINAPPKKEADEAVNALMQRPKAAPSR
jgi:preprotein translocase subunit SecD